MQDEEAVREGRRRRRSCRRGMWTPAVIKVGREESREDEHKLRHKSEKDTTLNAASGEKRKKKGLLSHELKCKLILCFAAPLLKQRKNNDLPG